MANRSFIVQYIIKARDQFTPVADKTKTAWDKIRQVIERAKKSVVDAANRISTSMKKIREDFKNSQHITEFGQKMRNTGAWITAGVTLPIALMGKKLIDAASDANETRSKFATVFRDITNQAESSADSLSKNFGLSGTAARKLMGDTGDLLTGFGFSQEAALKLSTQVNELAVDLASFTNYSGGTDGASAALTKALLGERESLKTLGIAIQEKDVKLEIAKMMARGQKFESMQQAKAYATLSLAVKQSGNAIGDFARTQHELANQQRILKAETEDMAGSYGKLLLPIWLKVVQVARSVVSRFNDLDEGTKKIILIIAGVAAVIGPVLMLLGTIIMLLPLLSAGFAVLGVAATAALGPIGLIMAGIAAAAYLIIANWGSVSSFFKGFTSGLIENFGPTITNLIDQFKEAAGVIAQLFGGDSEAAKALVDFSNIGKLIGDIVGASLTKIVNGISGMGMILGQFIGAVSTLDFSQFDIAAIKAEFMGESAKPVIANSRVDVGVNVGLDKGLQQTSPFTVGSSGNSRGDLGAMTQ